MKVQEEKEDQRQIKEQMREEEKALREMEKVEADAEKEEKIFEKGLKKAQVSHCALVASCLCGEKNNA